MVRGIRGFARTACAGLLLAGCAAGATPGGEPPAPAGAPALVDTVIQSNLSVPWDLAFAPDGRLFVTERMGQILMFESGKPNAKRISATRVEVHSMGEAGLMGIAVDPAFATNGFLYVC